MKLLTEISDATLGIGPAEELGSEYKLRKAARAILLNKDGLMAVQHLTNHDYHKLPGGGVDPGETLEEAWRREIKEEVGCDATLQKEVGMILEFRKQYRLLHITYCFIGQVTGPIEEPQLEPGEIEEGQVTIWVKPEEALELIKADSPGPKYYNGQFITKREETYVAEALKILNTN